MPQLYIKKTKKWWDIFFSMKYVYWYPKIYCFGFFGGEKCSVFESKSWWKYDIYWRRKSFCFDLFGNGSTVFFESRSWWKDDIYWLMRSSCFELYGDGKYGLLSAKKLMKRWYILGLFELSMIFLDLGDMFFRAVSSAASAHNSQYWRNIGSCKYSAYDQICKSKYAKANLIFQVLENHFFKISFLLLFLT